MIVFWAAGLAASASSKRPTSASQNVMPRQISLEHLPVLAGLPNQLEVGGTV